MRSPVSSKKQLEGCDQSCRDPLTHAIHLLLTPKFKKIQLQPILLEVNPKDDALTSQ